MSDFSLLHQINLIIHISCGSIGLILGAVILSIKKGNKRHVFWGRVFIFLLIAVVVTGLLGVLVFARNTFLIVLTMLSGYSGYSGYRIVKMKTNSVRFLDITVALLTLFSALYFIYYIKSIGFIWSPVVIYSTLGALFALVFYDFLRYAIPTARYKKLWLYEHIYKMTATFTALLSAFVGTVFPDYKPYSQFLPSVAGTILALSMIIYFYRRNNSSYS